uniref:Ribonuclease H-like domain-containing protein n=1 Tax=Tanacetum cinerariifolium TaxID=118510 RepID=A0A6L2L3A2_TANCI|nr:ribonuclease H-like domain-containing protein [Tanacetum cinerariifolium]
MKCWKGVLEATAKMEDKEVIKDTSRILQSIDTVWLSDDIEHFLGQSGKIKCKFPWNDDYIVDRNFWLKLVYLDPAWKGWLIEELLLQKGMPLFYANGERYTTPWSEVDQKGEYDIWAMKMEHYLGHTDYPIWEVIQKGNERERKARTTLLMAIPKDHLAKFHKITDAKEIWEAIKSRFGGNDKSKKMQKYILKQQFEGFSVSNSEGLHKDANQKFLRSLPSSWSQVSLIMRTMLGVYTLSFVDLYNNLRVFDSYVKGSTASSSITQNVAFVFSNITNSNNKVITAYGVSTSSGHNSQKEGSSLYIDDHMYSFFANQSSGLQLDHEDLELIDEFDLEEMDLKWQTKVEYFNCHNKGHFARECRSKGNQESRKRDVGKTEYKARDNGRRPAKQYEHKAMVTINGEGIDWSGHAKDDTEKYALMAFNSSNSGSDTEVTSCSKVSEAEKDKEELKTKLDNFQSSSKGLSKLLNSQMIAKDKSRLGDVEDSPVNDRFAKVERMHAVPPPMTGIYMPPKYDFGIDKSKFTYGPKQSKTNESNVKTNNLDSCESNSSVETLESVPKPVESKPKAVSEPKVWSDAPIIEEYELDSDDKYVFKAPVKQEKPSYAFINIVKHVKTPRQTIKDQDTCSQNPKVPKRD